MEKIRLDFHASMIIEKDNQMDKLQALIKHLDELNIILNQLETHPHFEPSLGVLGGIAQSMKKI